MAFKRVSKKGEVKVDGPEELMWPEVSQTLTIFVITVSVINEGFPGQIFKKPIYIQFVKN